MNDKVFIGLICIIFNKSAYKQNDATTPCVPDHNAKSFKKVWRRLRQIGKVFVESKERRNCLFPEWECAKKKYASQK